MGRWLRTWWRGLSPNVSGLLVTATLLLAWFGALPWIKTHTLYGSLPWYVTVPVAVLVGWCFGSIGRHVIDARRAEAAVRELRDGIERHERDGW